MLLRISGCTKWKLSVSMHLCLEKRLFLHFFCALRENYSSPCICVWKGDFFHIFSVPCVKIIRLQAFAFGKAFFRANCFRGVTQDRERGLVSCGKPLLLQEWERSCGNLRGNKPQIPSISIQRQLSSKRGGGTTKGPHETISIPLCLKFYLFSSCRGDQCCPTKPHWTTEHTLLA